MRSHWLLLRYAAILHTRSLPGPLCISTPTDNLYARVLPSHFTSNKAALCSPPSSTAPCPISARVPALLANSWVSFISCCLPAHDVWLCWRGAGCLVPCLSHHVQLPGERGQRPWCTYPPPRTGRAAAPKGWRPQDPCPPTSPPCMG